MATRTLLIGLTSTPEESPLLLQLLAADSWSSRSGCRRPLASPDHRTSWAYISACRQKKQDVIILVEFLDSQSRNTTLLQENNKDSPIWSVLPQMIGQAMNDFTDGTKLFLYGWWLVRKTVYCQLFLDWTEMEHLLASFLTQKFIKRESCERCSMRVWESSFKRMMRWMLPA